MGAPPLVSVRRRKVNVACSMTKDCGNSIKEIILKSEFVLDLYIINAVA